MAPKISIDLAVVTVLVSLGCLENTHNVSSTHHHSADRDRSAKEQRGKGEFKLELETSISMPANQVVPLETIVPIDPRHAEVPNPFTYTAPPSRGYEIFKTVLLSLTLLPIRLLLLSIILLLSFLFSKLSLAFAEHELLLGIYPLSQSRKLFLLPLPYLARFALFISGYYWVGVKGIPARREEAPLLICNHRSFLDCVFLYYFTRCTFLGKAEVRDFPIFGSISSALQCVFVRREDGKSRAGVLSKLKERGNNTRWPQTLIFPEGTITNGKCLLQFKQGAFTTGSSVQPIVIRYPYKHRDPSWVPLGPSGIWLSLHLLCQFINHVQIEFLPVQQPTRENFDKPRLFAERVRQICAQSLSVPLTSHAYEDMVLLRDALQKELPAQTLNVEFTSIKKLYELNLDDARKLLQRFSDLDSNHDGMIDRKEFSALLSLPPSNQCVDELFNLFDQDQSNTVDFRELVAGLSLLSKQFSVSDTLSVTWSLNNLSSSLTNSGSATPDRNTPTPPPLSSAPAPPPSSSSSSYPNAGNDLPEKDKQSERPRPAPLTRSLSISSMRQKITKRDLSRILSMCFQDLNQGDLISLFDRMDTQQKGFLTQEEFQTYASNHPEICWLFQYIKKKQEDEAREPAAK